MKNTLNITRVRIKKIEGAGNFLGYADITIGDCFMIHGIRIIRNSEGKLFLTMPSKKDKEKNEYRDIAHPISRECKEELEAIIIPEYEKLV